MELPEQVAVDDLLNELMSANAASLTTVHHSRDREDDHRSVQRRTRAVKAPRKKAMSTLSATVAKRRPRKKQRAPEMQPLVRQHEAQQQQQVVCNKTAESIRQRIAEASMKRLTLSEAQEMTSQLFDRLSEQAYAAVKFDGPMDVLYTLSVKRIVMERLRQELIVRKVTPVTVNTLSTLFASVYVTVVQQQQQQ